MRYVYITIRHDAILYLSMIRISFNSFLSDSTFSFFIKLYKIRFSCSLLITPERKERKEKKKKKIQVEKESNRSRRN